LDYLLSLTFRGLEGENDSIAANTKVAIAESVFFFGKVIGGGPSERVKK
jgi:hypothetical protein